MDTDWFQEALRRVGTSQADLARHLDLPPSAVSRMLRGERQMKIQEALRVAQFLGVPQDEVVRHAGAEGPPAALGPVRRGRPPGSGLAQAHRVGDSNDMIPIRRSGEEVPVGYTPRPANLAGVRDAYAVYVETQSLTPRYEPGWLLHVNPFKPAIKGRDVVVRTKNGTMLIRQFGGWDGDTLILRQLTPDETNRVSREEVTACHLIVGVDQEG
jgi:transcriptional regulator with XRE-family HTH domain